MEANLTVNILLIISLICTMSFSFTNINLDIESKLNKVNNKMILLTIFMLLSEICYLLLPITSNIFFIIINHILRIITLLILPLLAMLSVVFLKSSLGLKYNLRKLILTNIFNLTLCILNLKYNFIYIINGNNEYCRSYLFILYISIPYIYLAYFLIILAKHKTKFSINQLLYFLLYVLLLLISSLVQIILKNNHFFWPICAAILIINYILIQEKVLYYNDITLNRNKFALTKTISSLTLKGDTFFLIFIKIENLNSITKSFGSKEKYNSILYTYKLSKAFLKRKGELFHCTDDCFVALINYNSSTNVNKLMNNINLFFSNSNNYLNTKYTLMYNFYYDIFNNNYANIFDYFHHINTIIYNFPCNITDN